MIRIQDIRSGALPLGVSAESTTRSIPADTPVQLAPADQQRLEFFVQNTGSATMVVSPSYPRTASDGVVVPPGGAFKDSSWRGGWWARASGSTSVTVVVTRRWT